MIDIAREKRLVEKAMAVNRRLSIATSPELKDYLLQLTYVLQWCPVADRLDLDIQELIATLKRRAGL